MSCTLVTTGLKHHHTVEWRQAPLQNQSCWQTQMMERLTEKSPSLECTLRFNAAPLPPRPKKLTFHLIWMNGGFIFTALFLQQVVSNPAWLWITVSVSWSSLIQTEIFQHPGWTYWLWSSHTHVYSFYCWFPNSLFSSSDWGARECVFWGGKYLNIEVLGLRNEKPMHFGYPFLTHYWNISVFTL